MDRPGPALWKSQLMILEMLSGQGFNSFGQLIVGVTGLSFLGRKPWERPRACLVELVSM